MDFTVPELPYAKDALEPVMSKETLEFHYEKHHKGYMTKLKAALEGKPEAEKSLEEIVKSSEGGVFNNAAQIWNHTFWWNSTKPNGGGAPPAGPVADLVEKYGGWDKLRGGAGDDTLFGSEGDDFLNGGQGNDVLNGGSGNDILIGLNGDNTLTGGSDADIFLFKRAGSNDTVTDFEDGVDMLYVNLSGISDIGDVVQTDSGADLLLTMGATTVTLEGLAGTVLTADDFVF